MIKKVEINKLIPLVIDKTLKKKEFEPTKIYNSLLKETDISDADANKVVREVVRKIVAMSSFIEHLTSPMIREITNTTFLQLGFEEERPQYTRIGIPRYDLKEIYKNNSKHDADIIVAKHIRTEYSNVDDLIKLIRESKEIEKPKIIEKPKLMSSTEYLTKKKIKKVESKKIWDYF